MTPDVLVPSRGRVRATYEAIAESFAQARREPWPEVVDFAEGLPPASRVLDVGCGSGRHVFPLASAGHSVVGVDLSRRMLHLGAEALRLAPRTLRAHWVEGDATDLPLRAERFDACTCVAVLHHMPTTADRVRALREIRRVLSPDGVALISVWALDQPRFSCIRKEHAHMPPTRRGDVEVPWTLPDGTVVQRYYHLFDEAELRRIIIESGLRGESFFRGPGNHFAIARRERRGIS